MDRHTANHAKDKPFRCPRCKFSSRDASTFVDHLVKHRPTSRIVQCCFCSFKAMPSMMKSHVVRHGQDRLDCSECTFWATSVQSMLSHVDTYHKKKHKCVVCAKLLTRYSLAKHMKNHSLKSINLQSKLQKTRPGLTISRTKRKAILPKSPKLVIPSRIPLLQLKRCRVPADCWKYLNSTQSSNRNAQDNPKLLELPKSLQIRKPVYIPNLAAKFGEALSTCNICDYQTRQQSLLKRHLERHNGDLPLVCRKCNFQSVSVYEFANHMLAHGSANDSVFACCFCNFWTHKKQSIPIHLDRHRVPREFDCPECEEVLASKTVLQNHFENFHHKLIGCQICGEIMTKFELDVHVKEHSEEVASKKAGQSSGPCAEAEKSSKPLKKSKYKLVPLSRKNIKSDTKENRAKSKAFTSSACSKSKPKSTPKPLSKKIPDPPENTKTATKYKTGPLSKRVKCQSIDSEKPKTKKMKLNESPTEPVGSHECKYCDYRTEITSLMDRHKEKHKADTPLKCTKCEFQCLSSAGFAEHFTCHFASRKKLPCPYCSHHANSQQTLLLHIDSHRNVRFFDCSKCQFTGRHASAVRKHFEPMHVHKYTCTICDKVMTKHVMMKHLKKRHPTVYSPVSSERSSVKEYLKYMKPVSNTEGKVEMSIFDAPAELDGDGKVAPVKEINSDLPAARKSSPVAGPSNALKPSTIVIDSDSDPEIVPKRQFPKRDISTSLFTKVEHQYQEMETLCTDGKPETQCDASKKSDDSDEATNIMFPVADPAPEVTKTLVMLSELNEHEMQSPVPMVIEELNLGEMPGGSLDAKTLEGSETSTKMDDAQTLKPASSHVSKSQSSNMELDDPAEDNTNATTGSNEILTTATTQQGGSLEAKMDEAQTLKPASSEESDPTSSNMKVDDLQENNTNAASDPNEILTTAIPQQGGLLEAKTPDSIETSSKMNEAQTLKPASSEVSDPESSNMALDYPKEDNTNATSDTNEIPTTATPQPTEMQSGSLEAKTPKGIETSTKMDEAQGLKSSSSGVPDYPSSSMELDDPPGDNTIATSDTNVIPTTATPQPTEMQSGSLEAKTPEGIETSTKMDEAQGLKSASTRVPDSPSSNMELDDPPGDNTIATSDTNEIATITAPQPTEAKTEMLNAKPSKLRLKCKNCDFQTVHLSVLHRHNVKHKAGSPIVCSQCHFQNNNPHEFLLHWAEHFPDRKALHCCYCPFATVSRVNLALHLCVHNDTKVYECSVCPYSTSTKVVFEGHMWNVHKKVTCQKCQESMEKYEIECHGCVIARNDVSGGCEIVSPRTSHVETPSEYPGASTDARESIGASRFGKFSFLRKQIVTSVADESDDLSPVFESLSADDLNTESNQVQGAETAVTLDLDVNGSPEESSQKHSLCPNKPSGDSIKHTECAIKENTIHCRDGDDAIAQQPLIGDYSGNASDPKTATPDASLHPPKENSDVDSSAQNELPDDVPADPCSISQTAYRREPPLNWTEPIDSEDDDYFATSSHIESQDARLLDIPHDYATEIVFDATTAVILEVSDSSEEEL